jgi:ABC-type arginine transport system ATPase subunit
VLDCKSDKGKLFLPRIKSRRNLISETRRSQIDENTSQYDDIPKKYKITSTGDRFALHDSGFNDLRGIICRTFIPKKYWLYL